MATKLSDSFDILLSTQEWEDILAVFVGFFSPALLASTFSGIIPGQWGPEVWGVGSMVVAVYSPWKPGQIAVGSGVFVTDSLAQRYGLKQSAMQLAGSASPASSSSSSGN